MDETSDLELLRRIAGGDREAFAALYRRRQRGIYRFALQMCGSPAAAEDITQEVFLLLIRQPGAYEPARGPVAAFLYGVARNLVLRHGGREQPLEEGAEAPGEHPEAEAARWELVETVRAAVLALPVHYREAVVLCDLEEMDYAEAASALGCAVGTVRSRLHRGRQLLARRLRPAGCAI
jgi:RNA polymerase sigma-70 factor (ECF subfamily)